MRDGLPSPFHDRSRQDIRVDLGQHVETREGLVGFANNERRVAGPRVRPGFPGTVSFDWLHRERRRLDVPRVGPRVHDDLVVAGDRCAHPAGDRIPRIGSTFRLVTWHPGYGELGHGSFLGRARNGGEIYVEGALRHFLVIPPDLDPDSIAHCIRRKTELTFRLVRFLWIEVTVYRKPLVVQTGLWSDHHR